MDGSGSGSGSSEAQGTPPTYFAPAGRACTEELEAQIGLACSHPLADVVLQAFGGIVLILNPQRQIVAVNRTVMRLLGIEDPEGLHGLRPGEALSCLSVEEAPEGCGTAKRCATCGAVIAILASQQYGHPLERECLMTTRLEGRLVSFEFMARASPLVCDDQRFTVITLQDIRSQKRQELLQRVFFHDVMDLVTALQGTVGCLSDSSGEELAELAKALQGMSQRLFDEISSQRDLHLLESGEYALERTKTTLDVVLTAIRETFAASEVARDKQLELTAEPSPIAFSTDVSLLLRVLINIVKNALEATPPHGRVRLWCEREEGSITFKVWNAGEMPPEVALRVFQRYFSTKDQGRGLGTYSIKLIGEQYLRGSVDFTTSSEGTLFSFRLPVG